MNKKVCGIQISGSKAIFVILQGTKDDFGVVDVGMRKIQLDEYNNQNEIISFKETVEDFLNNENCSKVLIKARAIKGNYRGGSVSFIIEGIIQTIDIEVEVIQPVTIANHFKNDPIDLEKLDIYKYQHDSFKTAYYGLDE